MNNEHQPNNPLHGVTIKDMLTYLEKELGWEEMGRLIRIKCFNVNPSLNSSLTFLRKTAWAKIEVEKLYLEVLGKNSY